MTMTPSKTRILANDSDCGGCNTGSCVEPAVSNLSTNYNNDPSSSSSTSWSSCDCKNTGFIGEHCEVPCSKECENGGKCLPATESMYGVEFCSCSKAVVDGNPFAGLLCEFGATKSCMMLGSESKHSFCTNGGECIDIVGDNEQHKDCICLEGYEGPHCEYVVGTAPGVVKQVGSGADGVSAAKGGSNNQQSSSSQANSSNNTSDMIVYIMIAVVGTLILVLLLAFGARSRKKKRFEAKQREREIREATEDLSMIPNHNQPENDII